MLDALRSYFDEHADDNGEIKIALRLAGGTKTVPCSLASFDDLGIAMRGYRNSASIDLFPWTGVGVIEL